MSIHNAMQRRRTPQSRKWKEHRRKGKKSLLWGKGRLKKWTRLKRKTSRRERIAVKRQLHRACLLRGADFDSVVFGQIRPKRRAMYRSLRSDHISARIRSIRIRFKAARAAATAAKRFLD